MLLTEVLHKRQVIGEAAIEAGDLAAVAPAEGPADAPAGVGHQLAAQLPGVNGVGGVEGLHLPLLKGLADGLEVGPAMLLDERLEEGHAEHLAFAFVDAGGEVFVDVVAEEMATKE